MKFEDTYAFAIGFATAAHIGQVRKYTGEPYVEHTIAVAKAVHASALYLSDTSRLDEMVEGAILHDVLEDTEVTFKQLVEVFGAAVAVLVFELTDEFTAEKYPSWNRTIRKSMEAERLHGISDEAKFVKREDIANNTASIEEHDPKFAEVYLVEKEAVMKAIT